MKILYDDCLEAIRDNKCSECNDYFQCSVCDYIEQRYEQGRADALNIDMEKPMHFTDEQKAWVKNYIIINAKRQRIYAINKFVANAIKEFQKFDKEHGQPTLGVISDILSDVAEQLKEQQ